MRRRRRVAPKNQRRKGRRCDVDHSLSLDYSRHSCLPVHITEPDRNSKARRCRRKAQGCRYTQWLAVRHCAGEHSSVETVQGSPRLRRPRSSEKVWRAQEISLFVPGTHQRSARRPNRRHHPNGHTKSSSVHRLGRGRSTETEGNIRASQSQTVVVEEGKSERE